MTTNSASPLSTAQLPRSRPATVAEVAPWLLMSVILVILQVIAGFIWPESVKVTAVGIGGQALIVGHYAAIQGHRDRQLRTLWWMLALTMFVWAFAFTAIVILKDVLHADESRAMADSLMFTARGAPLLLMLTCGIDDEIDSRIWRLDIAQAMIHIAAVALLILGNPMTGLGPISAQAVYAIREFQNIALVCLAIAVALLQRDRPASGLFLAVAAMMSSYLVMSLLVNRVFIIAWNVPSASPLFAVGAVPMLVFLLARTVPPEAMPDALSRFAGSVGMIAPTVVPFATIVMVLTERLRGDPIAPVIGVATLVLYGWRMMTIQMRHKRSFAELAAAHSHAAGLSLIDPLTALGNRRSFELALASTVNRAQTAAVPGLVSVLMIDADWFKGYNDSLGHGAGDIALRRIATALSASAPPNSAVVRMGGEEFAIVTRVTDSETATRLAEQVRSAVSELDIPHPRSPMGHLTISIGVATCVAANAEGLMAAADIALYRAKHAGRNQVHTAGHGAMAA